MLETILSLDPIILAAGAAIAVGAILAPVVILKKKRKNVYNPLTNPVSTNDAYKTEIDDFSPETYTVGTEDFTGNSSHGLKPKNLSNNYSTESVLDDEMIYEIKTNQERMQAAIDLDKQGKRAKVSQVLKMMVDKEEDNKEQKRLQVIVKHYNKGEVKLADLAAKFPTFLKTTSAKKSVKNDEDFAGVFNERDDSDDEEMLTSSFKDINTLPTLQKEEKVNRQSVPVLTEESVLSKGIEQKAPSIKSVEDSLKEMAEIAEKQDLQNMQKEEDDTEVLRELTALAGMGTPPKERAQKVIYSKEVWANWMSMTNGKMGLKTKFISLENKWPNKAAVEELEQKINTIMGKDANGNQNAWALISVHQLHEGI